MVGIIFPFLRKQALRTEGPTGTCDKEIISIAHWCRGREIVMMMLMMMLIMISIFEPHPNSTSTSLEGSLPSIPLASTFLLLPYDSRQDPFQKNWTTLLSWSPSSKVFAIAKMPASFPHPSFLASPQTYQAHPARPLLSFFPLLEGSSSRSCFGFLPPSLCSGHLLERLPWPIQLKKKSLPLSNPCSALCICTHT